MKKLDITLNKDAKEFASLLNSGITIDEFKEDFDTCMKGILRKIADDEIRSDTDLIIHFAENVPQDFLLVMAKSFIRQEWKRVEKDAKKKFLNKKSKKEPSFANFMKAMMKANEMKEMLKHDVEIHACSKEQALNELKEKLKEKGVELDISKFDNINNREDFLKELDSQLEGSGMFVGGGVIGNGIFRKMKPSETNDPKKKVTVQDSDND